MSSKPANRDAHLTVRVTDDELLTIDARAMLSGIDRSEFVRQMIDKSWGLRLAKAHRPYVGIAGVLLDISSKLSAIKARDIALPGDVVQLEKLSLKLDSVLDKIIERVAADQERELNADHEEETFE
jgi:hypothetical protein